MAPVRAPPLRVAVLAVLCLPTFVCGTPAAGTATEISSFTIPKSPSGMFYYASQDLLYVLCGTQTNGDHYIYAYTTSGTQQCFITIPQASQMARVDGFYIVGSTAYIVDSQGPMHSQSLGGSLYAVTWDNPCGCASDGTCTSSTVTWSPVVTQQWTLAADNSAIADGGGNDNYFRNSGIVVNSDASAFFAVNGVHPNPDLTCCYPKSLVKVATGDSSIMQTWSFTASTLGHDVDMEGLTCGSDDCANYMYIGDEWNYIYKLNLGTSDPAAAVEMEWDINTFVGNVPADKGIESLTYASSTGYFYAGIQETMTIHVLELSDGSSSSSSDTSSSSSSSSSTSSTSSSTSTGSIDGDVDVTSLATRGAYFVGFSCYMTAAIFGVCV